MAAESGTTQPIKVILLGDSAVGKSKLVERFLMDGYEPHQDSTYALTLYRYNTEIEGKPVAVDFWDTAGQERFDSLHPSYYYAAHACILVFDITRKVTYTNLSKWYAELQENRPSIPCIVVANKIDLDLKATKKSFNFASKRQLPFAFVSASEGTNVVKVFTEAVRIGKMYQENPEKDFFDEVMDLIGTDSKDSAAVAVRHSPDTCSCISSLTTDCTERRHRRVTCTRP